MSNWAHERSVKCVKIRDGRLKKAGLVESVFWIYIASGLKGVG